MVTGAALCDPEGGLLEEAGRAESPATHPAQPERNAQEAQWNLPTWEDIVRTHSARVYRLAYRLTGNPHDAEDLTQEVFVRVFRSLSSYTPGTFEGWLHRITTNLFLDSARRRQRIRFEGLADEMAHRLAGSEPTPAQAFDDSHLDDDVQAALKALPPEYRAAVVLCDIEGFSYEEIAATLGVKLGTVRSRIHRGRAQLRSALEHRRPGAAAVSTQAGTPATTPAGHEPAHAAANAPGHEPAHAAANAPGHEPANAAGHEAAKGQSRRQGLVPRRLKRAGES
jgi:RNA polymerase sigma factor (sigma-70 family)